MDDKVSLAVPQLYRRGIEQKEWTQTKFWTYMIDGFYQSIICFYFTYLEFAPANFTTESGRNINDYKRLGVYIVNPIVLIVNVYILINTYRWDWFMCLITGISILLIWFWTGVYTAFTAGFTFYEAAPQVYGALSFWAVGLLTVIMALLPRFAAKAFQKMYFPYDIDIIREQVRQGKFDYLKDTNPEGMSTMAGPADGKLNGSTSSSEISNGQKQEKIGHRRNGSPNNSGPTMVDDDDDRRPIYPPSEAGTRNPRSHNGSDGTDYTGHSGRPSVDPFASHYPPAYPGSGSGAMGPNATYNTSYAPGPVAGGTTPSGLSMIQTAASSNYGTPAQTPGGVTPTPTFSRTEYDFGPDGVARPSMDRPRPSFDRLRSSMDRTRPSFEASNDFTSAAYLTRVESSQSTGARSNHRRGESKMKQDISEDLR